MFRLEPARAHIVTRHFSARSRQNVNWNSNNYYFGSRLNCCQPLVAVVWLWWWPNLVAYSPLFCFRVRTKNIRDWNKHATDADIRRKPYDPRHTKATDWNCGWSRKVPATTMNRLTNGLRYGNTRNIVYALNTRINDGNCFSSIETIIKVILTA